MRISFFPVISIVPGSLPVRASSQPPAPPEAPADGLSLAAAATRLVGERVRTRWEAQVSGRPVAAVPWLDGQGMVVETTDQDASRRQIRLDASGQMESLPQKPVAGSRQSRSATLADGSEVVFSWDTQIKGPSSYDFDDIRLSRLAGQEVLWTQDLGILHYQGADAPISWPPVAMPNGNFLMARNGVECHDADGRQLWSCPGEIYGNFSIMPSIAGDGTAFIVQNYMQGGLYGRTQSRLHGYRPDGSHWQRQLGLIQCSPAISREGGAVVCYSTDAGTRLEKLTPEGKTVWQRELPGRAYAAVLEDPDGHLLLSRKDAPSLVCYDPESGSNLWEKRLLAEPVGLPVRLPDSDVLVATSQGQVTCLTDNQASARPILPQAAAIQTGPTWVVVGGVRIPRRSRPPENG